MGTDDFGNLGGIDRVVRVASGLVLVGLCVFWPGAVWGLLGVLPIATGIAGESPLYRALGISTRPLLPTSSAKESS
jgi:hypothetical protein